MSPNSYIPLGHVFKKSESPPPHIQKILRSKYNVKVLGITDTEYIEVKAMIIGKQM